MTADTLSAPQTSFVVIAYNEERNIGACLSSILSQEEAGSLEVVVVDDGSQDTTSEIVSALSAAHPEVRLLRHDCNRGRGFARATGLSAARGRQVAMVDSDVRLPADWLRRASEELVFHDAVGGIPVPDGDVTYLFNRFGLTAKPCPPTIKVSGTNGLYRRQVLDAVTMDPTLTEGEDVAFNKLAAAEGFSFATVSTLLVDHCEAKGFAASMRWLYESGIGATRQLARYREIRSPDVALAAQLGALGVGLVAWTKGQRVVSAAIPLGCLTLVAAAHAHRKFALSEDVARGAQLVAVNAALIASYFAGRVVGALKLGLR